MSDWPELSYVEKARPTESSDVVGHGELTVDKNAPVIDNGWKLYRGFRQRQRLCRDFTELIPCTQPDDSSLVLIHFQTISGHPVADNNNNNNNNIYKQRSLK